jgi:hypothetical protein
MNKSQELKSYIENRNYELSGDEIINVLDARNYPDIDHVIYENEQWNMWDIKGNYYYFKKRKW